jgi:outer membrane receptor protein involved in Fe transport
VTVDFGSATTPLGGSQWNVYAGDRWQLTDRLAITGGVRADLLAIDGHAPYHAVGRLAVRPAHGLMPRRRPELSPRVGFVWEPSGSDRQRVRGGLGTFAGRYPLAWAQYGAVELWCRRTS